MAQKVVMSSGLENFQSDLISENMGKYYNVLILLHNTSSSKAENKTSSKQVQIQELRYIRLSFEIAGNDGINISVGKN